MIAANRPLVRSPDEMMAKVKPQIDRKFRNVAFRHHEESFSKMDCFALNAPVSGGRIQCFVAGDFWDSTGAANAARGSQRRKFALVKPVAHNSDVKRRRDNCLVSLLFGLLASNSSILLFLRPAETCS